MIIVNLKKEKCDLYIGRSQKSNVHFGNPFVVGPHGTRKEVVDKYELWLRGCAYTDLEQDRRHWIIGCLHILEGKRLGDYCEPELSHGNVLIKLFNERNYDQELSLSFGESKWK